MRRERCDVCRRRIRRAEQDNSTYWLGPARGNGMAWLSVAHPSCYAKVTADMHASARERALLLANTMGRVRADRSEASMDALKLVTFAMAAKGEGAQMFEACHRTVDLEDDDEFRETVEHVLSRAGLVVHDRLPDGQTTLRREGIDPD
jgi:hypothetical protein